MAIRRRNQKRSARRDNSTFKVPVPSIVAIAAIAEGVSLISTEPITLNPVSEDQPVTGLRFTDADGSRVCQDAVQVSPFHINAYGTSGPTHTGSTFTGTLGLSGTLDGIRNSRGGGIALGEKIFP